MAETYFTGEIRELELSFTEPGDAAKVCQYLVAMKGAA